MVNSNTSKVIYVGAYVMGAIALVGMFALLLTDRPVPPEIYGALSAIGTFIMGAHIKAPVNDLYPEANKSTIVSTTIGPNATTGKTQTVVHTESAPSVTVKNNGT